MSETTTLHLVIHGRVQGVWYRDSMRREAQRLNVTGWVRNRPDGTVEAMVQGGAGSVETLLRWARRGPQLAEVGRIDAEPGSGSYSGFEVRG